MKFVYTSMGTLTEEFAEELRAEGLLDENNEVVIFEDSPMEVITQKDKEQRQQQKEGITGAATPSQVAFVDGFGTASVPAPEDGEPEDERVFEQAPMMATPGQLAANKALEALNDLDRALGDRSLQKASEASLMDIKARLDQIPIKQMPVLKRLLGAFRGGLGESMKPDKKLSVKELKNIIGDIIKEQQEGMEEWPRAKEADPDMADELVDYTMNDPQIYRHVKAVLNNLKRKVKKGVYDPTLAAKLWTYVADAGAKKYEKEFRMSKGNISPATRRLAGVELEKAHRFDIGYLGEQKKKFGPLGLSLEPEKEEEPGFDPDDPVEWEKAALGASRREEAQEKDPMRFSPLSGVKRKTDKMDFGLNEKDSLPRGGTWWAHALGGAGTDIGPFRSLAEATRYLKEERQDPGPFRPDGAGALVGENYAIDQIAPRTGRPISSGRKKNNKNVGDGLKELDQTRELNNAIELGSGEKDPEYIIDKVAEATSLVTFDDPNTVSRFYGIVRDTEKDLEDPELTKKEKEEFLGDLANYFIDHMTDESSYYEELALEPDDPETGRSALDAAGVARSEGYIFRKMDPVILGRTIIRHFSK